MIDEGDSAPIAIACKGHCTNAVDPLKKLANQELGMSVFFLVNNAKIDMKRQAEVADGFSGLF
jgi:hypothetical protein